jgi:hypothetical protein
MPAPDRRAAVLALAALCGGAAACAHNPAPDGAIVSAEAMQYTARGGYILIEQRNGIYAGGELLAVAPGAIHVQTDRGPRTIPLTQIQSMRLAAYETGQGAMAGWGALGVLSTLSHGFVLIFSAPIWLISTGVAAGLESRGALVDYPGDRLEDFRRFARYPQGLPTAPPTAPAPGPAP